MNPMHPPTDRRCQIYIGSTIEANFDSRELLRCTNVGTHWEKWGGRHCPIPDSEVCEGDYHSWECTGGHTAVTAVPPC